jgi:hypothetical protein
MRHGVSPGCAVADAQGVHRDAQRCGGNRADSAADAPAMQLERSGRRQRGIFGEKQPRGGIRGREAMLRLASVGSRSPWPRLQGSGTCSGAPFWSGRHWTEPKAIKHPPPSTAPFDLYSPTERWVRSALQAHTMRWQDGIRAAHRRIRHFVEAVNAADAVGIVNRLCGSRRCIVPKGAYIAQATEW